VQYVLAIMVGLMLGKVATLITTIYLRPILSHKPIRLHPAVRTLIRLGTWMFTSISPRAVGGRTPQAPQLQRRGGRAVNGSSKFDTFSPLC
jgi:hypothetical protein